MAKFFQIGKELINLDQVCYARPNYDGKGGLAIQLASSGSIHQQDGGGMTAPQQYAVSRTVLFFKGADAVALEAAIRTELKPGRFNPPAAKQSA